MKPLLLLVFLSFSIEGFAQKDSDDLSDRIDVAMKAEPLVDKDLSLELGSEKMTLVTRRSVDLHSSPGISGVVKGKLKKGVEVQQLDIIGSYYLVCHNGQCGYVLKKDILKIDKQKIKRKTLKDSTSIFKSNEI